MLLYRVCPGCRSKERGVCRRCLAAVKHAAPIDDLPPLQWAGALFDYDDRVQRIVLAAKNGGRRDVIVQLGTVAAASFEASQGPHGGPRCRSVPGGRFDAVTWVPASSEGVRRRGYDQGRLLAGAVASRLGIPCRRLLLRRRGQAQARRGRADRLLGPEIRAPRGAPQRVLLVDDVITTGTSLVAAANALRGGGALSVVGLAIARSTGTALEQPTADLRRASGPDFHPRTVPVPVIYG
ncbi:MAG: ComF family protein [Acidimicrobiales bacterium]